MQTLQLFDFRYICIKYQHFNLARTSVLFEDWLLPHPMDFGGKDSLSVLPASAAGVGRRPQPVHSWYLTLLS